MMASNAAIQRKAAAAYIKSQQHEGGRLLGGNYDDGGYFAGLQLELNGRIW